MAALVLFDEFKGELGKGTHLLHSHTFKLALTNTAPVVATDTVLANITQIANGFGYTTGGTAHAAVLWEETGAGTGIWRFVSNDVVFTAAGGSIATFRYGVLYNDTPTAPADPLIGYIDYGASVTVTDTNTFTFDVNATNGWFRLDDV